ncbi:MAG: arabinose isomerase, partial [Mucilaginibacter sp.]
MEEIFKPRLKVGLFGIGLQAYWEQFDGLEQRLKGYVDVVAQRLQGYGAEIVNLGLVDTPEKAFESGSRFRREEVDLIFLYVTTYA